MTTRLFSWATREGHETLTRLLLEVHDIIIGDDEIQAWSSLVIAAHTGHWVALAFHLSDRGLNHYDFSVMGPRLAFDAARRVDLTLLDKLLNAGVNIEQPMMWEGAVCDRRHATICSSMESAAGWKSSSALMVAVDQGHEAVVERLLQAGVDVNHGGPLLVAVGRGHEAIVCKLLQAGADRDSDYILWTAVDTKHEGIVDKLLQAGAAIHQNCLSMAISNGLEAAVGRLLQAQGDVLDEQLLNTAVHTGNDWMVETLLQAGAVITPEALSTAIVLEHKKIINRLLLVGVDVDKQLALEEAASKGDQFLVDKLLMAGADANNGDSLKNAISRGHETVVVRLLTAGADGTREGLLCGAASAGHPAILDILLKAGASVNGSDIDSSPLVIAMNKQDGAMVASLLDAGARLGPVITSTDFTKVAENAKLWDPTLIDLVLQEFAEASPKGC